MFISVKHQRQQQEVKFWFPAIGAYQLLQARELVYRIDDLSSWTLHYIVSFNFRACKIDLFEPTCQAICLAERNYIDSDCNVYLPKQHANDCIWTKQ